MRVLTYTLKFIGHGTASLESQFYDEYVRLARHIDELIIITPEAEKPPLNNIKIPKLFVIDRPKLRGITLILSYVFATIQHLHIDLIYIRTLSPPEFVAGFVASLLRKRVVYRVPATWCFEPPTIKNLFFRWFFARTVQASKFILLYSKRMLQEVRNYAPVNEEKVVIVRNAVDTERFKRCESARLRAKLGIGREKVVLYVGRISPSRGVHYLIKAIPKVVEGHPNVKFILVGNHAPQHLRFKEKLMELAEKLGVADYVIFTGPVPNDEIPQYYSASNVLVLPTLGGEGVTRAVLEAMSCEVPVVSTPDAGLPDVVLPYETGLLVPKRNAESLAEAILTLLKDAELSRKMGRKARELIVRGWSWDSTVPQLVKVIYKAMK
jgi:glycosyltransferase involved in cell wall biosynthesis